MPAESSRAVFLSYASQDAEAVRVICDALRAAGIEAWFDQSELRGGEAWDQKIRRQIKECALFVPVISANTQARREGYFRIEWKLAAQRTYAMADGTPFIVPVVIDATRDSDALVPDEFRAVQWLRFSAGGTPGALCDRVKTLLGTDTPPEELQIPANQRSFDSAKVGTNRPGAASSAKSHRHAGRRLLAAIVGGSVAIAAVALWRPWEQLRPRTSATPASNAKAIRAMGDRLPADLSSTSSVAVLPFRNQSDDPENEYFSDGISEELLTVLQKIPGLRVAARMSAFSFKGKNTPPAEVGEKLAVAHLVEGSVQKSGGRVKIVARLVRAATGEEVWSRSFPARELKDVFALQEEITQAIVVELKGHLSGEPGEVADRAQIQAQVRAATKGGTLDGIAHEHYLQGRFFHNQFTLENFVRAVNHFQRAVEQDPKFVIAWAALAQAEFMRAGMSDASALMAGVERSRIAVRTALALDGEQPHALCTQAGIQAVFDYDWRGAMPLVKHALAIAPNDPEVLASAAKMAIVVERYDETIELSRRVLLLDPANIELRQVRAAALAATGRFQEAEAEGQRLIDLNPTSPWSYAGLAGIYVLQGRFSEAVVLAEKEHFDWSRWTMLAIAKWGAKDTSGADADLRRLIDGGAQLAAYQIGEVYAYRGQADEAFTWFERAYRQRDFGLIGVRSDPFVRRIRSDPRWPALLHKIGLADEQLK